ncbi:unnamed protein product [Prorocentrum cordatum]|uniref:Pentatricopeptide repeat-containing protein n=1 Tax=Prorocentrum cordatum TaxID=2364126 RepID=A0ABN9YE22_9DINO|nr:unnamed protein product [Polarella glacialis]
MATGSGAAQRDVGGEVGTQPLVSYSVGISACERGKQWRTALAMLSEMRESRLEPNPDVIYISMRPARVRRPSGGSGLFAAQRDAGGEAAAQRYLYFSYSAGISACQNGVQWHQAFALLSGVCEAKPAFNSVSHASWTNASETGWQCQRAVWLHGVMREANVDQEASSFSPAKVALLRRDDTAGYSAAALGPGEKGGHWQQALWLVGEILGAQL